jgi:hypothetical protein
MTYRFAMGAFWAVAALAKIELPRPLSSGAIKALLLRHLRWWAAPERGAMFHTDGTQSIGFAYPNMYMSEDYNSPQSVYWCLKSFVVLAIPSDDDFWLCKEEQYPVGAPVVDLIWPARQLLVNHEAHTFALSAGQGSKKPFKAREAKYGKFAYSALFGFSVPTGPLLHQVAPDSTLALSFDGGETWSVRRDPYDVRTERVLLCGRETTALVSRWKPWAYLDVVVETTLAATPEDFPGWHVRKHRLSWSDVPAWAGTLQVVDGGFAIDSTDNRGLFISQAEALPIYHDGWAVSEVERKAFVRSRAGVSGIADFSGEASERRRSRVEVMRPDPNTNLLAPRTQLPVVRHDLTLEPGSSSEEIFVTGVFGIDPIGSGVYSLWASPPWDEEVQAW